MTNFLDALSLAFNHWTLVALVAGTAIGIVTGAIPGIGPAQTIPISIPFTLGMEPITALAFLIGQYVGGIYGGSISAILINTPGTPASIATLYDGYPLARRGYAGKAIRIALQASVIGDLFATIVLILVAGYLAQVALRFGPAETAAIALLSMTLIVSVAGKHLLLGVISALTGAFLACAGIDSITGTPRFTFGLEGLQRGIDLVPMIIGLYAVAEILDEVMSRGSERAGSTLPPQEADQRFRLRELWQARGALGRGTALGIVIGVLPGLGSSIAGLLAYSWERRVSKTPEEFGTGKIEGIVAPEAANNAETAGALLPFLTLGIPGSTIVAILGGAFMLHGLIPGPRLFVEKEVEVTALFIVLILSKLALFLLGSIGIGAWQKLLSLPRSLIMAMVLVLCFGGTYVLNSEIFDLWVVLAFGVLGVLMRRVNVPREPLLIAFILAPMFEFSLRQALIIAGGDLLSIAAKPLVAGSLVLALASLVWQSSRYFRPVTAS
jgi:putative tricarboxylic transport membrane protein